MIRTSIALGAVDPGFDTTNVLTMRMSLTGPRFAKSEGVEQLIRDGVERIEALPGVVAASASCCIPLQGGYGLPFVIAGRDLEGRAHGGTGWATVSPGYFEVFQIPIKRGRAFTVRDDIQSPPVVLINESMAREHWSDGDPLHDRLIIGRGVMKEFSEEPERQIIGVVGDVRDGGLNRDPGPKVYVPQVQLPDAVNALNVEVFPMAWVIRAQAHPLGISSAAQEELCKLSGLPVSDVLAMSGVVSNSTARHRFNMQLMIIFGCAALLLAVIGIYGLMAYSVEQRTQEIGIRLALGAQAREVRNMVVLQGMRVALAGVVVGIAAAFGLARYIESLLFGVETGDTLVFVVYSRDVGCCRSGRCLAACPRHASCIDPNDALRYQ